MNSTSKCILFHSVPPHCIALDSSLFHSPLRCSPLHTLTQSSTRSLNHQVRTHSFARSLTTIHAAPSDPRFRASARQRFHTLLLCCWGTGWHQGWCYCWRWGRPDRGRRSRRWGGCRCRFEGALARVLPHIAQPRIQRACGRVEADRVLVSEGGQNQRRRPG